MKWSKVKLIFLREGRDQLRDRRTLFTIVVLPVLLYPLMGMVMLQMAQFMQEHPTKVLIVGADSLPQSPPLLEQLDGSKAMFHSGNIRIARDQKLLDLSIAPRAAQNEQQIRELQQAVDSGKFDAGIYFPSNFADELERFRRELAENGQSGMNEQEYAAPAPHIYFNTASDKSRIAHERVERILQQWRSLIVRENLRTRHIPEAATEPFEVMRKDVAKEESRRAALWSKVMPFVVLIWALTGAFYPAIDLCAGEKERGTLETLLSSPAERSEIVWGKLLTVMAFSMATSLLNMISMGVTALVFVNQFAGAVPADGMDFGPPPTFSLIWLLLALPPTSALFSALAMAIAAFARSSKEGQYYLMPLLFVTLPLMLLPMLPTFELTLGTSLIPLSGLMMLLRALIEGQYRETLAFVPPVVAVTAVCCLLAIRWAIDQFSNENVLFRDSERGGISAWLRYLMRVRGPTPSVGEGLLCAILLLIINFFAKRSAPANWSGMVSLVLVTQLALIATPALLMTLILTRSPRKTLLLNPPAAVPLIAAVLLALTLHPIATTVGHVVSKELYPLTDETKAQIEQFLKPVEDAPPMAVVLVFALIPAICEELAFRGFILSGLRHMGHKWAAIIITAMFFGFTHGIIQQQLTAALFGVVLGYIAVQTGSIFAAMAFHFLHNALTVLEANYIPAAMEKWPVLEYFYELQDGELIVTWPLLLIAASLSAALLYWFHGLPYQPSAEERLRKALDHQTSAPQSA